MKSERRGMSCVTLLSVLPAPITKRLSLCRMTVVPKCAGHCTVWRFRAGMKVERQRRGRRWVNRISLTGESGPGNWVQITTWQDGAFYHNPWIQQRVIKNDGDQTQGTHILLFPISLNAAASVFLHYCEKFGRKVRHLSRNQGEADWHVVPWILLDLLQYRSDIYLLPVFRNLTQSPWPFKDEQECPCNDINQLPQRMWVHPIRSHVLTCV